MTPDELAALFTKTQDVAALTEGQLLERAVELIKEAEDKLHGMDNKAGLWILAQLYLSERSSKKMLRLTTTMLWSAHSGREGFHLRGFWACVRDNSPRAKRAVAAEDRSWV